MRRIVWLLALLPVLLALVFAAGCGGDDDDEGERRHRMRAAIPAAGVRPAASRFASVRRCPLTGDFAEPGVAAQQGYEVWMEMVNDSGGLLGRPVEMVIKDDQSDQNLVVTDYNALIDQDQVDLLLGTFSSLLNIPASAVAERAQMVYVEPAGGSPDMFNRGFEYLFFAQQATAPHQADLFSEWVTSLPEGEKPKTAAYIAADDPFGAPVAEGIQEQLEAAGIETVYSEIYPPETVNFDAIASDIAAQKPDVIAQGSAGLQDGVNLITALSAAGYSPKQMFQASTPSFADQYSDAIGVDNTEGIFYAVSYHVTPRRPGTPSSSRPTGRSTTPTRRRTPRTAYAAAQVLQAAVEAVGSIDDQAALKDWLHENSVETILGELSWDETGAPEQAFLARPVAERRRGDRAAGGRRHVRHHRQPQASVVGWLAVT